MAVPVQKIVRCYQQQIRIVLAVQIDGGPEFLVSIVAHTGSIDGHD